MRIRSCAVGILFVSATIASVGQLIAADDEAFEVLGLLMKTEAGADDTQGSMSVVRVDTPPGSGPPAHIHRLDDELFVVLEGQYRFWIEGKPAVDAGPGDVIFMPRGIAHQYLNTGDKPGRHYFVTVPGGLDELFAEIHSGELAMPKDREMIIQLSEKYGIEYVPPLITK